MNGTTNSGLRGPPSIIKRTNQACEPDVTFDLSTSGAAGFTPAEAVVVILGPPPRHRVEGGSLPLDRPCGSMAADFTASLSKRSRTGCGKGSLGTGRRRR